MLEGRTSEQHSRRTKMVCLCGSAAFHRTKRHTHTCSCETKGTNIPKASVATSEVLLFRHLFGVFLFPPTPNTPLLAQTPCKPQKAVWPWRTPAHKTLIKQH